MSVTYLNILLVLTVAVLFIVFQVLIRVWRSNPSGIQDFLRGRKDNREPDHEYLVPLMEEHGVDLVLLGHDHLYGRSRKVNGVTYVISGGGGSSLYRTSTDDIMEVCEKRYNYVRFQVSEQSISCHAGRFTKHDLAHIHGHVVMTVHVFGERQRLRIECILIA